MKCDVIRDEYIMVCKCKGCDSIMALFDNNRVSVNGLCRIYPMLLECPRCKERYQKVRDSDPEFPRLMEFRWKRYGSRAAFRAEFRAAFPDN